MLAHALKSAAVVATLGLGAIVAPATWAWADTYKTSCYGDDCVKFKCNDWGRDCIRIGYYRDTPPIAGPYEYIRTYTEYPDYGTPRDPDTDYDSDGGLYYHYRNHFDPDNDYDEYPG